MGEHRDKPAVGEQVYDTVYYTHACVGADWLQRFIATRGQDAYPQYRQLVTRLGVSSGQRALDAGCGRGEVVAMLSLAGVQAFGLDYSRAALDIAQQVRQACRGIADGTMDYVRGDATTLPFHDGCFDHIVLADIVEHLHDWQLRSLYMEW